MVARLGPAISQLVRLPHPAASTLLGAGSQSLLRTEQGKYWIFVMLLSLICNSFSLAFCVLFLFVKMSCRCLHLKLDLLLFTDLWKYYRGLSSVVVRRHGCPPLEPLQVCGPPCLTQTILGRELMGSFNRRHVVTDKLFKRMQLFLRSVGHLSAVYCMLFDRSGKYVNIFFIHMYHDKQKVKDNDAKVPSNDIVWFI